MSSILINFCKSNLRLTLGTPCALRPTYKIHIRFFSAKLCLVIYNIIIPKRRYWVTSYVGAIRASKNFKKVPLSAILFVRALDCGGHKNEDKGNG